MNLPARSFGTIGRDLRQFITNSTPLQILEIGTDLRSANQRLLRSPGILSRRDLRGFLPLRRQLSDQPSRKRDAEP
jgi:hypothetical protein